MAVDLHIHTNASGDGEFSPQEINKLAKENELQAIAITDHDSVNSVEAALYWGEKYGVEVIPSCEFSSRYNKKWLHILGYFIDYRHPNIKQWCDKIEEDRKNIVDAQIAKLWDAGFYLEKEKVLDGGSQPMPVCYSNAIFLDRRNENNKLLSPYRTQENGAIKFCLDWIATGRPYNVPQYIPDAKEVIRLIVKCGGIPILAHPAATLGIDHDELITEFLDFGLRGVEAFTTWHTKEQEEHYFQFCQQQGIIATCGSDFHGKSKPHISIGQVKNNGYDVVEQLKRVKRVPLV
jgi:predicted metal-dependent phosphoesterase TrpH